jgi:colanic acid/amylovoran biosynthesis glycosyltransferase
VLHVNYELGGLTERWVAVQTRPGPRYGSLALGRQVAAGASPEPHWIVSRESLHWWLAHRLAARTDGWSAAALASIVPSGASVLHAHFGPVAWAHRRLAQRLDAPLVAAFYGEDACAAEFTGSPTWRRRYRRLFEVAGAVLAEGPSMAERVAALGCPSDKVQVVRLPADEDSLADLRWAPPTDRFRVVAGARFTEKKGFDTAVAAFARGLGDRPDAELVLLGGGELEPGLRRLSEELRVADRVSFPGLLPHGQFMSAFAASHVAVFPSRTASNGDSEGGAPVTLVEAGWIGIPSVVSDHDDLPFVTGPEGSIVVTDGAVDAWAAVLRELYEAPGRLARVSGAASAFVREHHSPRRNALERERVYDHVAG